MGFDQVIWICFVSVSHLCPWTILRPLWCVDRLGLLFYPGGDFNRKTHETIGTKMCVPASRRYF